MGQFEPEEASDGYIRYVHPTTGRISHLDPHLDAAMDRIALETNAIRYTTYRVAAKLSMLATELFSKIILYYIV